MTNTLQIQKYEEEIAVLRTKIDRLVGGEHPASFYTCSRCGALYQSIWGCGCPYANGTATPDHAVGANHE